MHFTIQISPAELAETKMTENELKDIVIDAIDDRVSLPGYGVSVNPSRGAVFVPANFTTHRGAWRDALVKARDSAPAKAEDSDEVAYWQHEIDAFDRSFDRLLGPAP